MPSFCCVISKRNARRPKAISVVKKRGSEQERTIREFTSSSGQIKIGNPMREFRGVLTAVPVVEGSTEGSKGLQA